MSLDLSTESMAYLSLDSRDTQILLLFLFAFSCLPALVKLPLPLLVVTIYRPIYSPSFSEDFSGQRSASVYRHSCS